MIPTATDARPGRGWVLERVSVVVAAAGLALVTVAAVSVAIDDDPAGPKILDAADATAAGNPTVTLGEMFIRGDLSVDAGATLTVVNSGAAPHNLVLEGGTGTPVINRDEGADLDLSAVEPGTYTVYCAVEGHRSAGMEAQLVIGER